MNDHPTARSREAAGSLLTAPSGLSVAARALAQRILAMERSRLLTTAPDYLHADHGGLVVCGPGAAAGLAQMRLRFSGLLAEDPAVYEKQVATTDEPFELVEDVLFGGGLDDVLQQQIDRGADIAITPTRYVKAGDPASLKAIMKQVNTLNRGDVVVTLPVSIGWLRAETLDQLIAVINEICHPVALILGSQRDPLTQFAKALPHLRILLAETAQARAGSPAGAIGLWRTDTAGFDALAQGAAFAAVGAGGSLRHLVPAGERTDSSGGANYPTVLLPRMLRFSTARFVADSYANADPPTCSCPQCEERPLDRFLGLTDAMKAAAHAHNAATWNTWLPDLFAQPTLTDRQSWWRDRCRQAIDAHETENTRIDMPGRFKPSKPLQRWAAVPAAASATSPAGA